MRDGCRLFAIKGDSPATRGRASHHDYLRHGTTTQFPALNVLDGTVIGRCMARHRHQEFLRFLNTVEAAVPAGKLVHCILDSYGSHKHPKVVAWLERHPRWTFHFTPTSGSPRRPPACVPAATDRSRSDQWLHTVEIFSSALTRRRIRKRIEEAFGWIKEVALQRRARHRGTQRVGWQFTLTAAAEQSDPAAEAAGGVILEAMRCPGRSPNHPW